MGSTESEYEIAWITRHGPLQVIATAEVDGDTVHVHNVRLVTGETVALDSFCSAERCGLFVQIAEAEASRNADGPNTL